MSQVDPLHFFNNTLWTLVQILIIYFFICIVYVQYFYKIFRLRLGSFFFLDTFMLGKNKNLQNLFDLSIWLKDLGCSFIKCLAFQTSFYFFNLV